MTPYEKFAALNALDTDAAIVFSEYSGKVYVTLPHVEIGDGAVLRGFTEHRATFEETIEATWKVLTTLPLGEYLVFRSMHPEYRKHFRWNGYMWQDLHWKPEPVAAGETKV